MATPHTAATLRNAALAGKMMVPAASGVKRNHFNWMSPLFWLAFIQALTAAVGFTFDLSDSGVYSVAEPRLLWERVERLVPRSSSNNSGSGGSSSSSSSSNSSSQPGSHCGSGERFRARCESQCSSFQELMGKTQAA